MGCPAGWIAIGSCNDDYKCESVKCGTKPETNYREIYVRCQKGSTTECHYDTRYKSGCC
ncbi:hypothetical protein BRLA_c025250 [Brevibacillus laterosporus LMG 15441]|uniref:Uncharacterized protein n=1 Tax=Brevibacillus laterosporus LMG 15441 TaxID=1042163 RepID=A0A075R4T9_BRELA|nr:hypothetical protein BRLA_c025250 [Brevibacillus laterosporus LMG 15441]